MNRSGDPMSTTSGSEIAAPASSIVKSSRLVSLDVYRGLVLLMLCLEEPHSRWYEAVQNARPDSSFWSVVTHQMHHIQWAGCVAWDLIQPSFMFMVGVSMVWSYAKRQSNGDSWARMLGHVIWRSVVLILLGVFLRSVGKEQTYWTFEDVLTQIGLGYTFLFLLWNRSEKIQWVAIGVILVGYWLLFALSPVYETAGNPRELPLASGFLANWNVNANPAHFFDVWFLNLFPRSAPFEFHPSGYNTLNFIPSLAIMILGLIAGGWLKSDRSAMTKLVRLTVCGVIGIAIGYGFDAFGVCPLVKKTWTSGFTLFSGGCCFLILASLYGVIDVAKLRTWSFPLVVLGMNSIALYVLLHFLPHWIVDTSKIHFGHGFSSFFGPEFQQLFENVSSLVVLWLFCFWMYRKKLFVRI
jgi:predicted acyltransferase